MLNHSEQHPPPILLQRWASVGLDIQYYPGGGILGKIVEVGTNWLYLLFHNVPVSHGLKRWVQLFHTIYFTEKFKQKNFFKVKITKLKIET